MDGARVQAAVAGLLAVAVTACGSGGPGRSGRSGAQAIPLKAGENALSQPLRSGRRGGTLNVYTGIHFKNLDPGSAYFALDYAIVDATQRPLFSYAPHTQTELAPNLATEIPTTANHGISDGGRTVTVHIEPDVHFSPPVGRVVTSADVAYAIERGAEPNVGNAYFRGYFGAASPAPLLGASEDYVGGPLAGIRTPNRTTIVFHMAAPGAASLISALSLPLSAPVPRAMGRRLDAHSPTDYGRTAEAATGPYMIQARGNGEIAGVGYDAGRSLTLVRNPNWNADSYAGDYRPPAYLNRIVVSIGGDATTIGRRVLQGARAIQLDSPSPAVIRLAYRDYPAQMTITPGTGDFYAALNNARGVFHNVNVRRAVWANLDRSAIARAVGGSLVAAPMTHFIYPGNFGFTQAGGYPGLQVPWNMSVGGSLAVARRYMRAAGYATGGYRGSQVLQMVSADNPPFPAVTAIVRQDLIQLGFRVRLVAVDQSVMYSQYCGRPAVEVDVCPAVGWVRDFADPLSILYAPFYGPAIVPTNNPNFGQVDIPSINLAMQRAALVVDPATRSQAWADIDKQLVEQAVAAPEYFANQPNIESRDVLGVTDLWNQGTWDLAYTSLKQP